MKKGKELDKKIKAEGKALLRVFEAILQVRMLRSTIEGKDFDTKDIEEAVRTKGEDIDEIMQEIAKLMLEEYESIKRVKKLLKEV